MIHCLSLQLPAAHLARLDAQPVAHLVGQVRVAASTEHLEVCLNVVLASSCPAQTPHFLGNNKNTLDQASHLYVRHPSASIGRLTPNHWLSRFCAAVPGARCQVPGARCLCQVPEHWKVSFFVGAGRLGTLRWGISSEVKEIQETEIYRHYVWCYRRNWKVWKWIPLAFGPSPGQLLTRQSCWEAADDWSIGTLRARTLARGRCQETCCTSAAASFSSSSSSSSADVRRLPRLGFNSHLHHLVLRTSPGDTAPFLMASLFSEWQQKESLWKLEKNAKSKSAYSTKRKRTSSCHTKKKQIWLSVFVQDSWLR